MEEKLKYIFKSWNCLVLMIEQIQEVDVREDSRLATDSSLDITLDEFDTGCNRGFLGYRILSTETRNILGKPGHLVT